MVAETYLHRYVKSVPVTEGIVDVTSIGRVTERVRAESDSSSSVRLPHRRLNVLITAPPTPFTIPYQHYSSLSFYFFYIQFNLNSLLCIFYTQIQYIILILYVNKVYAKNMFLSMLYNFETIYPNLLFYISL